MLIMLAATQLEAKRNFTFNDAMKFELLRSPRTSNDGSWFAFEAKQDRGDFRVCIYSTDDTTKFNVPNGRGTNFSNDSKWAAITITPSSMESENKEKKNNKLKLINLQNKEEFDEDNLTNFTFSEDSKWLAYRIKLDAPQKPDKKDKSVGSPMKLKHLASGTAITIDNVTAYLFDTLSNYLFYIISTPDGKKDGIYCRELRKEFAPEKKIIADSNRYYSNLAWNYKKNLLAFLTAELNDKGKAQDCSMLIADVSNQAIDTIILANKTQKDAKNSKDEAKNDKKNKKDDANYEHLPKEVRNDEVNIENDGNKTEYNAVKTKYTENKHRKPLDNKCIHLISSDFNFFSSDFNFLSSDFNLISSDFTCFQVDLTCSQVDLTFLTPTFTCNTPTFSDIFQHFTNDTRNDIIRNADNTDAKAKSTSQTKNNETTTLTPADPRSIDTNWYLPSENRLQWNDSNTLLYFGMKPANQRYEAREDIKFKDSTYYNFDTLMKKSEVYVWSWNDPLIMTVQQFQWNREKDRTYYAVYHPDAKKYVQIADTNIAEVSVAKNDNYALAVSDKDYRIEQTWYGTCFDIYVINLNTGDKVKVGERIEDRSYSMSVSGNYIAYYKDLHWYLYDVRANNHINITQNVASEFYDIEQDVPSSLYSNGFGGWVDNDKGFFLYDNFDIWYFETANPSNYRCFTKEEGKKNRVKYSIRRVNLDLDYYQSSDTLIITAFNKISKDAGIYNGFLTTNTLVERVPMEAQFFRNFIKAKETNKIFFAKEKYHEFPNYYLTDFSFNSPLRVSDLNLHILDTFNWGRTELVQYPYKTPTGRDTTLLGYLVLPDNYDKNKKYPVFVYFYDQMSDRMNRFYQPELTHRPANQIFMDNYVMFFVDIDYGYEKASADVDIAKIGTSRPGQDAFDCIIAGCRYLAEKGIIDTNRACVQGHSWGGYQVAFMATIPSFFKAACAGAPVGNMTSAYSGIRTGSGRTRQFQYEAQQSRIGGNIFDSLDAYIKNSPIFFANNSTTPLLIGHGDIDEAVPYQQGVELYMAFRRAQKPSWLLQYVNEPHWQGRYWNKLDYSVKMKEFFDHYVLGKPAPAWMTIGQPYKGENWER